jgi:hypothetical protein
MKSAILVSLALVAAALPAAGCGSSSSSSDKAEAAQAVINAAAASQGAAQAAARVPASGATLTKAQYIRKADKLCRQMIKIDRGTFAAYSKAAKAGQAAVAAAILDRDTPAYVAWLGKWHALRQPKQDQRILVEILGTIDNQAQVTGAQAAALRSTSLPALNQIAAARVEAKKRVHKIGRQYGFKACGDAVQTPR